MRITLLTMGKTDIRWVAEGLEMYTSRLVHYVPFSVRELPGLKGVGALDREQIKQREGECLLKAVRPSDHVILLDEHGSEYTSIEFARSLDRLMQQGRDLVFVVGGAYGFSPAVYSRADSKLSLSKMTCSHQLVRTVFAEQLYRAFTILRGAPYHNE
ncbi:MAG: 23S rRNA (pseudouridine(1915)-N(3))-methyltransferase RlmH [Bacteroidales bacterium]|nr:23S rRNA (pseudouridine(1915)-N(3))-methyltransferase RlmH [Bacteroidales bacterium]